VLFTILKYFRVERYFARPLAALIVRAVYNTSITPNQITYVSFFLGILSGIAFSGGKPKYFILGGILAQLSSIVDCADGMLARSKDLRSRYGTYLDLFFDRLVDFFVFGGIILGYYRYTNNLDLFLIGLLGLSVYFLQISLYYLVNMYKQNPRSGEAAEPRGFVYFLILVCSLLNRTDFLIYILITETILNAVYRTIKFILQGKKQDPTSKI
jgi:CDP-L-myo-inositol myo-inositolphosphotransferase